MSPRLAPCLQALDVDEAAALDVVIHNSDHHGNDNDN